VKLLENAPLASRCTMGVGGPARYLLEATDESDVLRALEWAAGRGLPVHALGGGSNVVIADEGVDGLVVKIGARGVTERRIGSSVEVTAAAGEPWDAFVQMTVERGWAGIECLSGIPGLVGATPIQNVGAYGQEVAETITAVRAVDRRRGGAVTLSPAECGFGYRNSALKAARPPRYIVLAVGFRLEQDGAPALRYPDLVKDLEGKKVAAPSLTDVRRSVLAIRRAKSMVLDPADPNRRTCGSFFLNPIVTAAELENIERMAGREVSMPWWPERDGRMKLSAAWLIERAGFERGRPDGPAGLSTRHTLAIVCRDGARARDVVEFARKVRARVEERWGVRLVQEPDFWGPLSLD